MQLLDKLIICGESFGTSDQPLEQLPPSWNSIVRPPDSENAPLFRVANTACWRGYQATWEVKADVLWLVDIVGKNSNLDPLSMRDVFYLEELPAFWFTGEIRCGAGECISYNFMRFFEKTLVFHFLRGEFIEKSVIQNPVDSYRSKRDAFTKLWE
jgi:hypothetical protein